MTDLLQRETADLPAMLTIAEAATLLRISTSTARAMVKTGVLPAWRPARNARTQRIPKAALLEMIEEAMAVSAA